MSQKNPSELLRKILIIGGAIYSASLPLAAAVPWLAGYLGIMPGIEKAGKMEVVANATLVIGFLTIAVLAICLWIATSAVSDDAVFYPFVAAAWLSHHGLDPKAIGPFAFHELSLSFTAPHGFYTAMGVSAAVLLVVQLYNGYSNYDQSKDPHLIRWVLVLLWTLVYGLPMIGRAWHWGNSSQLSDSQVIPIAHISGFGWLCASVGAIVYGSGFVGFMTWLTRGGWKEKFRKDLGNPVEITAGKPPQLQ